MLSHQRPHHLRGFLQRAEVLRQRRRNHLSSRHKRSHGIPRETAALADHPRSVVLDWPAASWHGSFPDQGSDELPETFTVLEARRGYAPGRKNFGAPAFRRSHPAVRHRSRGRIAEAVFVVLRAWRSRGGRPPHG